MNMIWKLSADRVAASQARLTVLLCERRGAFNSLGAPVNCPRRAAVPAASCSSTPIIHQKTIPTFQTTGGASSRTIIHTDTSAAKAARNVLAPLASAIANAVGLEPPCDRERSEAPAGSEGMLVLR